MLELAKLHDLLDSLRSDDTGFTVLNVVRFSGHLGLIGYVDDRPGRSLLQRSVLIRCGPGHRPITDGMRLRLWRDDTGVYLEHCIP